MRSRTPGGLKRFAEIVHGKVHVLGVGRAFEPVAIGAGIEASEDGTPAVEIVPARAHPLTGHAEQGAIEARRPVDVVHREDDAKEVSMHRRDYMRRQVTAKERTTRRAGLPRPFVVTPQHFQVRSG